MSKLITVPVSSLTGAALDWSVALATGYEVRINTGKGVCRPFIEHYEEEPLPGADDGLMPYSPSTNWRQCGPLRDKYRVSLEESVYDKRVIAQCWDDGEGNVVIGYPSVLGTDSRVAICRAVVIANLGDTVDVPAILLGEI